jgi:hypothetical protein
LAAILLFAVPTFAGPKREPLPTRYATWPPEGLAPDPWEKPLPHIYWGDLHVHTNFSLDAWIMLLPPGRYAEEAGEYAEHCARLDFYSVTDHSEVLTRNDYWTEAIRAASSRNLNAQQHPAADGDPRIVAFTGWEWTQQAPWGHKNVILKYDSADKLPPSPIRSNKGFAGFRPQDWGDFKDRTFLAETPDKLYALLQKYCTGAGTGCAATVIPHGNAWGQFTMHTDWDIQVNPRQHDPDLQRLIEVFSKHGNSEEYRSFPPDYRYYQGGKEVAADSCKSGTDCEKVCSEPTASYEPCCHRAGELVRERCADPNSAFCREQIELARKTSIPFSRGVARKDQKELKPAFRAHPEKLDYWDWGVCGQCRDCYQPAYNYNPLGSVQKALASATFDAQGKPTYYRFGFLGSTDTHAARPGSVMEEKLSAELVMARGGAFLYNLGKSTHLSVAGMNSSIPMFGYERIADYLNPGGLVAIAASHRTRDDLWQALMDRHVYGTSGARLELWLRAKVEPQGEVQIVEMGDITSSTVNPTFYLKLQGALVEDGTCRYDEEPEIRQAMSRAEFADVCFNQCYHPSDRRTPIARIEVVKVRQPLSAAEARMADLKWSPANPQGLIMDPYATIELHQPQGDWTWTDKDFAQEKHGRSVAYYFRVIQEPTPGYNCRPTARLTRGKSCDNRTPNPDEVSKKANPQDGSAPVSRAALRDACYSDAGDLETYCEERAWTSPVYIVKE